jgi:hypothetical protein
VRGRDFSCEAETCRARRRLVVGIPLVGNLVGDVAIWPETGRLVLTRVLSLPHPESWP